MHTTYIHSNSIEMPSEGFFAFLFFVLAEIISRCDDLFFINELFICLRNALRMQCNACHMCVCCCIHSLCISDV